jgi:NADP-dependent 3-hydroxy acid dehydrogenase YdfG
LTSLAESVRADGGSIDVRRLDVTDRADLARFVDETVTARGRIDVIVNNAGVMPLSRLDSLLVDEWDRMVDVNVKGLLHGIAAAMPHFQRQNSGHFVTIASIGAYSVVPTAAVYCATKYAAWAITEGCGRRLNRSSGSPPSHLASSSRNWPTPSPNREPRRAMKAYRSAAISPDVIARAISYAIGQPADVDVNELVIRPVRQRP